MDTAARHTTARRGRWIAAAAGLGCLAIAGWLGMHWRELHVRYLLARLDGAQSWEEARGLIEQAMRHGHHAAAVQTFVDGMGPQRQRALFWFLTYLVWDAGEHASLVPTPLHAHPCRFLPLATWLHERAMGDEELLAMYSSYRAWKQGGSYWLSFDLRLEVLAEVSLLRAGAEVRTALAVNERVAPGQLNSLACVGELETLAEAWTLGMDVGPLVVELRAPTATPGSATARVEKLNEQVRTWFEHNRSRLAYDPATQRCKRIPDDAPDDPRFFGDRGYPVPSVPFPDWTGPVPEVPGMIR